MKEKLKVLIIDNSAVFRQTLTRVLISDPAIEVIATASNPYIAANKMILQVPDVITMDIEMPRMNGLSFLKKIMTQYPIPVVIISHRAENNMRLTLKALEYGAVEVMGKNLFGMKEISKDNKVKVCDIIKAAAHSKLRKKSSVEASVFSTKFSADAVLHQMKPKSLVQSNEKVIAIGASTGGINAISVFLKALPVDVPGIVIVQHLPENFTRSFAERLNELCKISVKEAEDGDLVKPGRALIAPGNHHMLLKKMGPQYYVEVHDGPLVNRHRPAVDVLFRSTALYAGKNGIGILMTGMGDDGARGLLEMKQAGARTVAQDEKSCIVFGMPKEAILMNAVDKILPLHEISDYVMKSIHV